MMLPIIAAQFLRGGWRAKLFCGVAGAFALNGLILTRTRAAFLGVCAGAIVAVFLALKGRRRRIFLYLLPGLVGGIVLSDAGFRDRMRTIKTEPAAGDTSASNRLLIWRAAGQMLVEHPLGVGIGNFRTVLSQYTDRLRRRDAHNTYIRCATELGIFGISALAMILVSAVWCLYKARWWAWRCPYTWQIRYYTYGLSISLVVMLTTACFMTQIYIEEFWWMLTLPVCLLRAAELEYVRTRELVSDREDEYESEPADDDPDSALGEPEALGFT